MENIVSAAKTDVFRVRINPEIKQELESVYAKNGLTLTVVLLYGMIIKYKVRSRKSQGTIKKPMAIRNNRNLK